MTKKRCELIVTGIILSLFLAGCSGGDTSTGAPTTPFLGGDGGLEIKFLEGNPPGEVTDGGTFPFQAIVSLKNIGEYDIPATSSDIKLSLIGFLPSQFKSTVAGEEFADTDLSKTYTSGLPGRKKDAEGNIIEPVETFVAFPNDNKNFKFPGTLQGNTIFVFRADACYKYKSKAISELCILQNQIDRAPDSICNPSEPKTAFSSASPVKMTSFRENVAGKDKVQFSFDITHDGNGELFGPDATAGSLTCPKDPSGRRSREDNIWLTVDTGLTAGYALKCVGLTTPTPTPATALQSGSMKLIDGKRTVTCTLDLEAARNRDFKKPIDITVDFNYAQNADKEVLVKHIVT